MTRCFSFIGYKTRSLQRAFAKAGLRSTTTDFKDGTVMHCWVPKNPTETKPNLLLIHGLGPLALWQWGNLVPIMVHAFNVYVPDLLFFGGSYTTRPERTDAFQAQCLMRLMEVNKVKKLSLLGLSYGGFVGYSMASQFSEAVDRVVICCAAVCMEEKDLSEKLFKVSNLEEAAGILVPQTPQKLKELLGFTFFRPPPSSLIPSCLLNDFIDEMCTEYVKEKRELIMEIPKGRTVPEIPKITQPTLILWGEHDQIFPVEFGYRLQRHVGDNARLVVIKSTGHAFNVQKHKEFCKHLKAFLVEQQTVPACLDPKTVTTKGVRDDVAARTYG